MPAPRIKAQEGNQNTYSLPRGEPIRRAMRDIFREQRSAVLRSLNPSHGQKALPPIAEAPPLPSRMPDWDSFRLGALALSERMTPLISAVWERAGAAFAPRVGLDPNEWSVVNPHTEPMIAAAAFHFCQSTNEATSKQLDDALHELRVSMIEGVVDEGEALPALTKRVKAIFDKLETKKARTIAQTESSRAVHAAQEQAAYATRGLVTGWRWLASGDACPVCLAIAARSPTVRLGEPFAIIGDNPYYKTIAMPPAHPCCNCSVTEVLRTDEQPTFHGTLYNPEHATDEEVDQVLAGQVDRLNEIQRTWDPDTGLYGSPVPAARAKPAAVAARPAETFGESNAHIEIGEGQAYPEVEAVAKQILGDDATLGDVASIVGATDASTVRMETFANWRAGTELVTESIEPDAYAAERTIAVDREGKRFLTAYSFFVDERYQGQGIYGPQVFGRMVENAIRFGFDRIETEAARGSGMNGYYTWPRFGYDADIPGGMPHRPAALAGAKRISDLMTTAEGRAWWKAHGITTKMTFDLSPGSLSRRIWDAYLAAKRAADKSSRRISRKQTSQRLMRLGRRLVG